MSLNVSYPPMSRNIVKDESQQSKTETVVSHQTNDIIQGIVVDVSDQLPSVATGDVLTFRHLGTSEDGVMSLQYELSNDVSRECNILEGIYHDITQDDYCNLSIEGSALEEYELERFERALDRVKTQRAQKQASVETKIDDIKVQKDELKKIALSDIEDSALKDQISSMLSQMNVPVSQGNITMVKNALRLVGDTRTLNDSSIHYLLQHSVNITPTNLYISYHTSKNEIGPKTTDSDICNNFTEVESQVDVLLKRMNQEGIMATKQDAKWLYEHDLAIDETTMVSYQQLKQLKEDFNIEDIIKSIIKGMANGVPAHEAQLISLQEVKAKTYVEQFHSISEDAVVQVVSQGKQLNLSQLLHAMQENTASSMSYTNLTTDIKEELSLVVARKQLEQIRLKLTFDSSMMLLKQGVNIQTEELEKLVEQLEALEDSYYKKLLQEGALEETSDAMECLKDTIQCRDIIKQSPAHMLGMRFYKRNILTLHELASDGIQSIRQVSGWNESYEALSTVPNKKYGDSYERAFETIDSLLDEHGMEASDMNRRAVRILTRNHIDVNATTIEQMKEYDFKVRNLIESLSPPVVMGLIEQKINPCKIPLNELMDHINHVKDELGSTDEEKYSVYLAKLEKSHGITPEQRDSYIGIYRLFRSIHRSEGVPIGYLLKNNQEITIQNLIHAVQTISGKEMDVTIDDSYGVLESLTYKTVPIGEQIGSAYNDLSQSDHIAYEYNTQLANQLYDRITPHFLQHTSSSTDYMEHTLEQMYESFEVYRQSQMTEDRESYDILLENLQDCIGQEREIAFLKNHEMKLSINNIKTTKELFQNPWDLHQAVCELLQEYEMEYLESVDIISESITIAEFDGMYGEYLDRISKGIKEAMEDSYLQSTEVSVVNRANQRCSLLQTLRKDSYYQIPIEVRGNILHVGLSIRSKQEGQGNMNIHIQSALFGEVNAEFKCQDQSIYAFIQCERTENYNQLQQVMIGLEYDCKQRQINMKVPFHQIKERYMDAVQDSNERNKEKENEQLFQVAKLFLNRIKEVDLV